MFGAYCKWLLLELSNLLLFILDRIPEIATLTVMMLMLEHFYFFIQYLFYVTCLVFIIKSLLNGFANSFTDYAMVSLTLVLA